MPYLENPEPQELLTQANAILGNGQLSLAKYLWISDDPEDKLDIHNIGDFIAQMLRRVDWRRDIHFYTRTTIDTLDYSGSGLNQGSKAVVAAAGPMVRELPTDLPSDLSLPDQFKNPRVVAPGILAIEGPRYSSSHAAVDAKRFVDSFDANSSINCFPIVTLVDDSEFASSSLKNWLWVTFTRSNPATDVDGIEAFTKHKHWGCRGSLVIDARIKPFHAPPLVEDPETLAKVDARAARGGALAKFL